MFFLRCAFWLTIVYASMSWPVGTFRSTAIDAPEIAARIMSMGRAGSADIAAKASAGVVDLCDKHRAECLEDAARLTSLIDAGDDPVDEVPTVRETTEIPLPVPDPRRADRGAKRGAAP